MENFQWPIPPGYEAVTRKGLVPEQLTMFIGDQITFPLKGVLEGEFHSWLADGCFCDHGKEGDKDLFIRKKVRVGWLALPKKHLSKIRETHGAAMSYGQRWLDSFEVVKVEYRKRKQ